MRLLTIIFFCVLCNNVFAQDYCNTIRYDTLDIFQNVQLKTDTLVYGYNYDLNGVLDTLGLFVFYPSAAADTATKRPMILMLHGGGFTTGSAKSMKNQAQYFARKGYVAVTVDYRIGLNKDCVPGNNTQEYASYRALQDVHAAGRYMAAHAAQYKIDTAAIFVFGRSAGAVTALSLNYINETNVNNVYNSQVIASLGGIHNSTNNYTNQFSIKGICSVSGGLTDTSVITAANLIPTQMFHGTADATVPYSVGYANSCNQFATVYGSLSIKTRIKNIGGVYDFYYQPGGGHGDIYETVDTFFYHHVSQFFKRIFCSKNRQATYEFTTQLEDINLNCSGANAGVINTNAPGFCNAGAVILNATNYSSGWGSSYQWQYSTDSTNWNNYAGAVNAATLSADSITATHWYRLKATCSYTNSYAYSNIVKVKVFSAPIAQSNAGTIACAAGTTIVTVSASGGTAPYSGEGNFEVAAGTYTYNITDVNGCTASTVISITQPDSLIVQANAGKIACAGGTTTVTVTASGGTAPYSGEGNFEVAAGTYTYNITDVNGCTASTAITVTQPDTLTAQANAGTIACAGGTTTVTVTASGGTAPYSGEGNFEVAAGTYTYNITDVNGCTASTVISITQPDSLIVQANAGTIACTGGTTTVTVSASGGTAPYSGEGNFEVAAGTYTYNITDANGCSVSAEVIITEPQVLSANANAGTIACTGGTTTVTVSASGGTAPYSGEGNFEVTTGTYNYIVTDIHNCADTTTITLVTENTGKPAKPGKISGAANNLCGGGQFNYSVATSVNTVQYSWEIPAGCSIIQNNNNSILVAVPSSYNSSGEIKVMAANGCGTSSARVLKVFAVAGNVSNKINGPASVAPYQTNVSYNVNSFNGFTYNWTVPAGAAIVSGQGTKKIFVNFGVSGGNVSVALSNACGNKKGTLAVTVSSSIAARNRNEENIQSKTAIIEPNPVIDKAIIHFNELNEKAFSILIKNISGKTCLEQKGRSLIGANTSIFNTSALDNGIYIISVIFDDKVYHLKMIKIK